MVPDMRPGEPMSSEKPDGFDFDAFLSYSRKDSPTVRDLVCRLEEKRVSAWFDEVQIDVGDPITEKIQEGLGSSRYLIVCLSRHFKDSEWCRREYSAHLVQEIKARTVRVLPVRLDDYTDEDVPDFLFDKYAVDVRTDDGLSRLARKLKTHLQIQSFGPTRISDTSSHAIVVEDHPKSIANEDGDLEASIQLWFPHGLARSFYEFTQRTGEAERLEAVGRCVDNALSFLTLLCLANYAAYHEIADLAPLLTDRDAKPLGEKIEVLSKMLSVTSSQRTQETFIPHLAAWALESEGDPSSNFLTLFKLALALPTKAMGAGAAAKRAEGLLQNFLRSLLWLQSYRPIAIGEVQYPRPTLVKGKIKSLVGVVKGFLPESFLWEVSPGTQLKSGCYILNPERTGLLRLDPFLLTKEELSRRSAKIQGGDLWTFSGLERSQVVFRDETGARFDLPVSKGDLLAEECSLHGNRMIAIKSVDERLVPNWEESDHGSHRGGEEDDGFVEEHPKATDFRGHLSHIQKALLKVGGASSDRLLVELDGIGADLLEVFARFPKESEACQELAVEWSGQVDQAIEAAPSAEARLVLTSRRREVESGLEDLLGGFSRSQSYFMNGTRFRGESPFSAMSSDSRDLEYGLRLLMDKDDLDQSDGIDWLLGSNSKEFERVLEQSARMGQRDSILRVLWRRFARIFLYYRDPFWDLAKYMLKVDSVAWRPRLERIRSVLEREISTAEARALLEGVPEEDRSVIAAFLAMHPRRGCREVGMFALKPADRWEILLSPAVHATVVHELIERSCKDCPPSYIKAMFLLLRGRLRGASTPLTLNHSFEILKLFYQVPLFLEASFFKALLALHKELNLQAQKTSEMAAVGKRFEIYMDEFRTRISARDNTLTEIHCIPLPIQRKLARDGYFVEIFVCNARDPIALESVPHALRRADVIRFFKSTLVNKAALQRLADDKHVMQEYSVKTAFCRNPKADPKQIRAFMPQIAVADLRLIAEDKNANQYARSLAKQVLMLRTS